MALSAKIIYKIEQIARLRLFSGLKDAQICELVRLTQSGLSRIVALPEYQEAEKRVLDCGITQLDEAVAGKKEEMRKLFAPAVPAAMRALIDAVTQRRDLRASNQAAEIILKRDPDRTFASESQSAGASADPTNYNVPAGVLANAVAMSNSVENAVNGAGKTKVATVLQPPDKNVN